MEKQFIYPKNYFSRPPISLDDSKWNLYNNTSNTDFNLDKINNNNIIPNNKLYLAKSKSFSMNKNKNFSKYYLNTEPSYNKDSTIDSNIYNKIDKSSSQLFMSLEKVKYLTQENLSLKQIIKNKDKIISDFEQLSKQFKEKFLKMDKINDFLKNKLLNKNEKININSNNVKELIDSFNNIKEDLNKIENDYNQKLKEKDEIIEKMNTELLYIHNEYKNLSNILEEMNKYIMNSDYNELKNKINDLMKQNEFLEKQNENREKRIIDLQKKNEQFFNEENYMNNNTNTGVNDDLIVTFKNQENKYVKTITMLQNRIIDKDKEIQMIKEEFKKIINNKERLS
jgi:chromosome segregation ATPase